MMENTGTSGVAAPAKSIAEQVRDFQEAERKKLLKAIPGLAALSGKAVEKTKEWKESMFSDLESGEMSDRAMDVREKLSGMDFGCQQVALLKQLLVGIRTHDDPCIDHARQIG